VSGAVIRETARLQITRLAADDAPFILDLLNDPDFLRYIGDRGVRTLDDAVAYITNGPVASYARHGFGLYLVSLTDSSRPIGIAGVLRRESLDDPDIGFAFLPAFRGQGYAIEAARGVMHHAKHDLGLGRIVAIVSPANEASRRLLGGLGFRLEGRVRLAEAAEEVDLFGFTPVDSG
jgi:[ribosomal protein S5]-alanine N-acetyltransferase